MLSLIQRAGRRVFLSVEGIFNLAFGDKLNPLYYLGPISYFMFWIVVASGLYLYVFFETSVTGAYDSVEALTHIQWYAGGILRSLHRYASDGMVLTMLLHLVRHFTFDRYRSFRWFSWVSGVALLWLVYVSGINGYMLPWDRLAQFVVIATAEWFDWLPMFEGSLVRNFIFSENFSDRLFSLLSFIHIGVPLGVLALLWVHTQRVPGARTSPPAPIMAMVLVTLVVLSLVKPALSQERADLAQAVTVVGFDWFYLPAFALLYQTSPGMLWALLGGATALFVIAPWLPPRRRRGPAEGYHALLRPDNRFITVRESETLLDAGLRVGVPFRFECRNGGCGECKAKLLYGIVDYGAYQPSALSEAERREGKMLLCCATPLADLELEYQPAARAAPAPLRVYSATVAKMEKLAPDVMRVLLRLPAGEHIDFYPGQYLNVLLDDGAKRSFSFATAPHETGAIELQIRRIPGGRFTTHVFEGLREGDTLSFEGPLGSFFLREAGDKPIIFVAGATGFAPVKSMLEHAFHRGMKRRMFLYWGVRRREDLYHGELAARWAREHDHFSFVPVLSEPQPGDHWKGRTGLVHEAIIADFPDLSSYQVYACGSAGMVEAAHPAFAARGLSQDDCFSDAFQFAPRVQAEGLEMVKLGGGR